MHQIAPYSDQSERMKSLDPSGKSLSMMHNGVKQLIDL